MVRSFHIWLQEFAMLLTKADIKSAFRLLPIDPVFNSLDMYFEGNYYFDMLRNFHNFFNG